MMLKSLQGRLNLLFSAFVLLVLVSVAAMIWGLEAQRQDALVINLAGRQRMLTQQMARLAFEAGASQDVTNASLQEVEQNFDQTLRALLDGGMAPYLAGTTVKLPATRNIGIRSALNQINPTWNEFRALLDELQHTPRESPAFRSTLQSIQQQSSTLVEQADEVVRLNEANSSAKLNRLRAIQVGFFLCALILLGLGVWLTRQSALKPLAKLADAANRLGQNDLETAIQVEGPQEMRVLSQAFESMRVRLHSSRQELVALNESLEERVAQRTYELETLNQVSREISSRLDVQQVLDSVTEKARSLLNGDVASLCLLDEGKTWLKLQAISGEKNAVRGQAVRAEDELAQAVLSSEDAVLCGTGTCQGLCSILTEPYQASHVVAPLRIGGQVIGTLCVASPVPNRFGSESARMLTKLANAAAVALENARLYSQAERVATLEERNRIAAEMHDGIGQTLSYLGLMTDQALGFLSDGQGEEAIEHLHKTRDTIAQAARSIRQAINRLLDETPLNQDLCVSLEESVKDFGLEHQLNIEWKNQLASESQCSREVSEQVAKIVFEALTNILKYADAKRVIVTLDENEDGFQVSIKDDGQGFLMPATKQTGHFGLQIMQVRAAHIGGKVSVESEPGAGTQISLTWPDGRKG
jgi:nitrate/nitrite-specific signal transduction histidine kinase